MADLNTEISAKLIKWYLQHKRELPWRDTKDPYHIWLSEIILQQTQVKQGLSYYYSFTQKYPTVKKLAAAKQDDVLKLWQGLGYYSRARNLHAAAISIAKDYNGVFPDNYSSILNLKGVGVYTASAISSFAYDLPYAVVDGNVYRLLSRIFDIDIPINSAEGVKYFQILANQLINSKKAALHNQAIMELGSQICKPSSPTCTLCPLSDDCRALQNNSIAERPVKIKKIKIKNRYLNYFLIKDNAGHILIHKRGQKDIWEGLFELFLLETPTETPLKSLLKNTLLKSIIKDNYLVSEENHSFKHVLSHQHLFSKFYIIHLNHRIPSKYTTTHYKKMSVYAWPRLIDKFLKICNLGQ